MRYFSMFSGIGGFEKGIEDAYKNLQGRGQQDTSSDGHLSMPGSGGEWGRGNEQSPLCVGFSEIDPNAINIYQYHYRGHKNYGDANKINPSEIPDFDLLVGGFPCQAFSIAGKRLGFDDTRGTLFFEIARILREKQPGQFLLENVKGLLSHDDGRTIKVILSTLAEMGYIVEWEVLNSKNFGVPQNRERIFIHGFREGCGRQVFPIGQDCPEHPDQLEIDEQSSTKSIGTLTARGEHGYPHREMRLIQDNNVPVIAGLKAGCTKTDCASTLMARDYKGFGNQGMTGVAVPVMSPDRAGNKNQNGRVIKEDGDPSFTLTAQDKHGVFNGMRIRRLTPVECERLQAFPDNWTLKGADGKIMSNSARYKACGNAVTTSVIRYVIEAMYG